MTRILSLTALCIGVWVAAASAQESRPSGMALVGGGASILIEPATGLVTSIRLGQAGEEMCQPHPAGSDRPGAFVEVLDLRDGRTYSPLSVKCAMRDWKVEGAGGAATSAPATGTAGGAPSGATVRYTQQYNGAPFSIAQTLRPTGDGIRWEAAIRLAEGQAENRSIQVTWAIPLPFGWSFWGPNDTADRRNDGVTPMRFVYGHTDYSPYGLVLPLVGVWGKSAGAAIYSPPDVRKCQIIFDLPPQTVADVAKGVHRRAEDLPMLRVTHHMVGLRPGKTLTLAVCIAAARPDWRGVLGQYVRAYPELFEPVPATRKWEGMYGAIQAGRFGATQPARFGGGNNLQYLQTRRVTCLEVHGHFLAYGEYVTREALKNPELTWRCQEHPAGELSLKRNREIVDQMNEAGVGAFMYYYNVHASNDLVTQRFSDDLTRGETGRPNIQYQGEPALRAQPDSPFGKQLLEQIGLLLEAYPKAPGYFVDNFSIQWLDFAHDDGVTMVHHRPAYDLNRNHQELAPLCFQKAHAAGKVIMVNKLATIESARGVDMVLLEDMDLNMLKANAFACVYRAVFPTGGRRSANIEARMQQLLLWGGTPGDYLKEYRPLTDALIGKRWVFDPDPLVLPARYEGQIFRIDPNAPHAGDVVVSLVRPGTSIQEGKPVEGLTVTVDLPEADQLKTATFLAAEKSDQPQPCQIERAGRKVTVRLPPVGAAGILRLAR